MKNYLNYNFTCEDTISPRTTYFVDVYISETGMRDIKNMDKNQKHYKDINRQENEGYTKIGTDIIRTFLEDKDPVYLTKCEGIYENIEMAIGRCRDIASITEVITLKNC